jgi:hypothetical protein
MGHVHAHDRSSYYLEQIWTIATCGALGVVMILLWEYKVLPIFLDPKFHDPVLWGGVALLVLVAIRITALWRAVGQTVAGHSHSHAQGHTHDHEHGPGCDHHDHKHGDEHGPNCDHHHNVQDREEHADEDESEEADPVLADQGVHHHEDDHGHDHGFAPWRYAVLLVPILLFLIRVPWPQPEEPVEDNVIAMKLGEVEESAESPDSREHWKKEMEAKSVRLKAKFGAPVRGDRMFNFVRLKMTCCAADAYGEPVKVIIESSKPLDFDKLKDHWIKVIGKLDYRKTGDLDRYVTVVKAESIKVISTPANQFDN